MQFLTFFYWKWSIVYISVFLTWTSSIFVHVVKGFVVGVISRFGGRRMNIIERQFRKSCEEIVYEASVDDVTLWRGRRYGAKRDAAK